MASRSARRSATARHRARVITSTVSSARPRLDMLWVSDFTYVAIWAGIEPSLGSVGDSYDNALAETINDLYKAKVIHRRGP
jgi:transposase InsO family protein